MQSRRAALAAVAAVLALSAPAIAHVLHGAHAGGTARSDRTARSGRPREARRSAQAGAAAEASRSAEAGRSGQTAHGGRARITIALGGGDAPTLTVSRRIAHQSTASVAAAAARAGSAAASVTVGGDLDAPRVPVDFLGLSTEYSAVPVYARAGSLFDQLLANLTPGERPVIRVGGDSADHAWIPVRGRHNEGLWDYLGHPWLTELKALATGTRARMVMGVNLEVDQRAVPIAEARAFRRTLGGSLAALELGNEPELYSVFPWYHFDGQAAKYTRSTSWGPSAYIAEVRRTAPGLGDVALWGPSLTATSTWWSELPEIAEAIPHLNTITAHSYPTNCYTTASSPHAPSNADLLTTAASTGLVDQIAPDLAYARATHRAFRIDETNTVSCAGADVLPDFASALWPLEAGFAFAAAGVSGINVHSFPYARTRLFTFTGRRAAVADEYYGWMLFARAAPAGSHLRAVTATGNPDVHGFATHSPGVTRVVLVNDSYHDAATVALSVPGTTLATVEPLRGPGMTVAGGVSFAGMRIAPASGRLSGRPRVAALGGHGAYAVSLPAASADLVTLTR